VWRERIIRANVAAVKYRRVIELIAAVYDLPGTPIGVLHQFKSDLVFLSIAFAATSLFCARPAGGRNKEELPMRSRIPILVAAALVPLAASLPSFPTRAADDAKAQVFENGIVQAKSAYGFAETIERLKDDVRSKGITFFFAVEQAKLAAEAGIALRPSTLLVFGNPALGSQFMTSNAIAGIDWPVRLLVIEDENGDVWAVYNDFHYIARRHGITDRDAAFGKAAEVIASITFAAGK
jgi:uncharacterized protein (DUF302 family)